MRIARTRPTAAAINADAPPSGIRPIFVNASMKNAFSEANTTSQPSANDAATPAAGPCTTATAGFGNAVSARTARLASSMILVGELVPPPFWSSSPIPAPELKPRPAPPSRTTRTRSSSAARSTASAIPDSIASVSELRLSGRFIVIDSTPSASVIMRPSTLVLESMRTRGAETASVVMATP